MTLDLRPPSAEHRQVATHEIHVALTPSTLDTAGVLGNRPLKLQGLDALLIDRLESVGGLRYRVVVTRPGAKPAAVMVIGIEKAYVQPLHETKTGVVVLRVEQDGSVSHLRGQSTGLNWAGSSTEMAAALASALDRALEQLRPRLEELATATAATPPAR